MPPLSHAQPQSTPGRSPAPQRPLPGGPPYSSAPPFSHFISLNTAPTSFYRHFEDVDELGLALVDEVGTKLRQVVRQARRRVKASGEGSVVRASIETFMEFATGNANLFRLLLGEGAGNSMTFRNAVREEVGRFTSELIENLEEEAKKQKRQLAHAAFAAEAMVTVAFNFGASALDRTVVERTEIVKRIVAVVRIIMRGAEAMGAGWEP